MKDVNLIAAVGISDPVLVQWIVFLGIVVTGLLGVLVSWITNRKKPSTPEDQKALEETDEELEREIMSVKKDIDALKRGQVKTREEVIMVREHIIKIQEDIIAARGRQDERFDELNIGVSELKTLFVTQFGGEFNDPTQSVNGQHPHGDGAADPAGSGDQTEVE